MDTSGLLKFYVEERGSSLVRRLVADADVLSVSRVGYAEARAGLARAHRSSRLSHTLFQTALGAFEERWNTTSVVEASDSVVRHAGALAEEHALRGFDAIHLASALFLQREGGEPVTFSAWDDRLLDAARAEGLTVAPAA